MKNNTMKNLLITCLVLMQTILASAQCDTIKLNVVSEVAFGDLKTEVQVENFNNISAVQIELAWNSDVVQLKDFAFNIGSENQLSINESDSWIRMIFTTDVFPSTVIAYSNPGKTL